MSCFSTNRVWVMDRGIPSEEVLAEMRVASPPVSYLVGTPKGRLSKLEKIVTPDGFPLGYEVLPGKRWSR
jgi:hypothetical protein